MAKSEWSLSLVANSKPFVADLGNAEKALEGVGDSLDDVAKDAAKTSKKVESEFKDMTKSGDTAAEKLERSFKDAAKDISRSSEDMGDDIGKGVKKGAADAGDALREAGDEAKQSGREAAASFSGEFDDVGDFIQETVANAFGGFGPLGVAAGIAGAAGIGLITSEITKQQEEADKLKERFASAYQTAAEEGRAYLDEAQIIAEVQDLIYNTDRQDEYKQAKEEALRLELDTATVLRARAGDQEAMAAVQARIDELQLARINEIGQSRTTAHDGELRELRDIERTYGVLQGVHDTNTEKWKINEAARRQEISNSSEAVKGHTQAILNTPVSVTTTAHLNTDEYDAWVRKLSNGHTVAISPRVAENGAFGKP